MKQLFLDDSDGDAFESICQKVFEDYFKVFVERTPLIGDGGKDLIIHHPTGLVYVECKHHVSPVGRPVVQKLHSAMVTDNIPRGIIVSTGGFSKDALEHISSKNLPIRTVDRAEFDDMANKAGYLIQYGSVVQGLEYEIKPLDDRSFKNTVIFRLDGDTVTGPSRPSSLISDIQRKTVLAKFYRVQYKVHSQLWNFKKDRLLNTIDKSGYFFINSQNRNEHLDDDFSSAISSVNLVPRTNSTYPLILGYSITSSGIQESLLKAVNERYSTDVKYTNRSGQRVSKLHEIKASDVEILNTDSIFLPLTSFSYRIGSIKHNVDCIEMGIGHPFYSVNTDERCSSCSSVLIGKRFMCNDCKSFFCPNHKSLIVRCDSCGRFVCKKCSLHYFKSLIFKKYVCSDCSKKLTDVKLKKN